MLDLWDVDLQRDGLLRLQQGTGCRVSDGVKREVVIRVDVPPKDGELSQNVTHFYSFDAVARMFYAWGKHDARCRDAGKSLLGEGDGWTVGGVSLDWLREDNSSARRD